MATYLHESAAPRLLGQDPTAIDGLRVRLQNYVGTRSTGVEGRGNSAVDLALWDLFLDLERSGMLVVEEKVIVG